MSGHPDLVWAWPPAPYPRPAGLGVARPEPGAPYHRLARTSRYRWWIPPIALLCVVVLFVALQLVLGLAGGLVALVYGHWPTDKSMFGSPVADLAFDLILLALLAPIVMLGARWVQRRPVGTLLSVEGRLRWRWLFVCALVSVPIVVIHVAVQFGLQKLTVPGAELLGAFAGQKEFVAALVVVVLLVPFQASAEEIGLRGFLMQAVGSYGAGRSERGESGSDSLLLAVLALTVLPAVGAFTFLYLYYDWALVAIGLFGALVVFYCAALGGGIGGRRAGAFLRTPVLGIAVSGTVFTFLHDYVGWGLVSVGAFGVALAFLTWYTGGLEAGVGLHVLHNTVVFALSAYEGTLADAASGGGSWRDVVGTLIEVGLYCVVVVWLARRLGIRRTVPQESLAGKGTATTPGSSPGAFQASSVRGDHAPHYGGRPGGGHTGPRERPGFHEPGW